MENPDVKEEGVFSAWDMTVHTSRGPVKLVELLRQSGISVNDNIMIEGGEGAFTVTKKDAAAE